MLTDIFERAAEENTWVDFYLEIPFFFHGSPIPNRDTLMTETNDMIDNLRHEFWDCFRKTQCRFSTTRFHYADIRLIYSNDLKKIHNANYYEDYIQKRVFICISKIFNLYVTNKDNKDDYHRDGYIENTDILVRDLYETSKNILR